MRLLIPSELFDFLHCVHDKTLSPGLFFKADLAVKTVHLHKHYLLSLRQMDIS